MNLAYKVALYFRTRFGANVIASNGTFDTAMTGWSTIGTPTAPTPEVVSGRAHVVADATAEGFGRAITLTAGRQYRISFDYEVVSGILQINKVGMTSILGLTSTGTYTGFFTENDGTSRTLQVISQSAAAEFYIDNISIQQVL